MKEFLNKSTVIKLAFCYKIMMQLKYDFNDVCDLSENYSKISMQTIVLYITIN